MSLIVSLTSTSLRLPVLKHTLISLLDQKYRADRIVLNISREPYLIDEGIKQLPVWLSAMVEDGDIEINWVENTGPYRKLIPVYRSAGDEDWIVTCDDDVIYGPAWLSSLVKAAEQYPSAIVCGRARCPVKNILGRTKSYSKWPLAPLGSSGEDLLPIGVAGVLYRKPLLDRDMMRSENYKEIATKQDDLWFNFARQRTGARVVVSPDTNNHAYLIKAPGALSKTNAKSKASGENKTRSTLFQKLALNLRSHLGFPVCDNDVVLERIERYGKSLH